MKLHQLLMTLTAALLVSNLFAAEKVSPQAPILTGLEPWPAGTRFVPGPYPPHRDDADLIGEQITAGTTWYDYQANGNLGKMIELDDEGNVHIVWMKGVQDVNAGERHCWYNYIIDDEPQFDGGVAANENLPRGGYNCLGFSSAVGAVPIFHATSDGVIRNLHSIDEDLGAGNFESFLHTRQGGGAVYAWPKGVADQNGRVHIISRDQGADGNGYSTLAYTSAAQGEDGWEMDESRAISLIKQISYGMAASRVSERVAIVFPFQAYPDAENARFAGGAGVAASNNDLRVFESENGVDWDWDNPINATRAQRPNVDLDNDDPLRQGDTLRTTMFCDAIYDFDDNLHVVFSVVSFWEQVNPDANPGYIAERFNEKLNMLWHWDRDSDMLSLVASGRYVTEGTVGNWRHNLSFPSLGANEDGTLYCSWTQYPERGDRAGNGYVNGEIYANVSVDGGLTWSVPINLTDTHTPNAGAGDCQSESWSTMASIVDDFLHISYVNDHDAGGIVQGEGQATDNEFMYHRVARDDIPTEPRQLGMDYHVGAPPQIAVSEETISAVAVPGEDAGMTDFIISNPAEEATGLWYRITFSESLAEVMTANPSAGRVGAGGELDVEVSFMPEEEGVIEGEIQIHHNVRGVDSPVIIGFEGLAAEGLGDLTGVVSDLQSGEPIPGVEITLMPGDYRTESNNEGAYFFDNIPAINYTLSCQVEGNLPFEDVLRVPVDDVLEFPVELRFGAFDLSDERIEISVATDEVFESNISITNQGNGPVSYTAGLSFPGGGDVAPGERRFYIPAAQTLNDTRLNGAAMVGDEIYVSGGANGRGTGLIYVLDREGNLVRSFDQFVESAFGMRDLAYDGTHLIGGDGRIISIFDTEGNLIRSFNGPVNPCRCIAWDPEREILFVCDIRSTIYGINSEGQEVMDRIRQPDTTRLSGLGYFGNDPEGFTLLAASGTDNNPNHLYKINPETGEFRSVMELPVPNASDRSGGIEITSEYDPYSYVAVEILLGNPDGLAIYQFLPRTDWISIAPTEGEIPSGESGEMTITFDTHGLPIEAQFDARVVFSHYARNGALELPISLTVTAEGGLTRRVLGFDFGWNLVSLNIEPDIIDVIELFRPLVESGSLQLVKDGAGNFYRPDNDFNNIERWNPAEGYQVKVSAPARLDVPGVGISFNQPIALVEGWQNIAYYPRASIDAPTALEGVAEQLVVVKDGAGRFYLPARDFINMDLMREGNGYKIKMDSDAELVYQVGGRQAASVLSSPVHFTLPMPTDANMSVLIESIPKEIIEISVDCGQGQFAGSGVVDPAGRAGLAVWHSLDGMIGLEEGQSIRLVGWDGRSETEFNVEWVQGSGVFESDGISIGRWAGAGGLPVVFKLHNPYPNPFNSASVLKFDLPETRDVVLTLHDLTGREVMRLLDESRAAGTHSVLINGESLATGLYFCRIIAGEERATLKITLIR